MVNDPPGVERESADGLKLLVCCSVDAKGLLVGCLDTGGGGGGGGVALPEDKKTYYYWL